MKGKIKKNLLFLIFLTLISGSVYASDIEIGILKDQKGNISLEMVKPLNFLGRSTRNDMVFKNTQISRRHSLISKDNGSYYIEDLFSKNYTYLNGSALIPGQRIRLKPGDTVQLTENGARFTFETVRYNEDNADAQRLISVMAKKYPGINLIRLDTKKQYSFEKDIITIGASEVNDIVVTETGTLPRQAIIVLDGTPAIEELSDRNGIRLNSKVVKYGIPRKLKSGDVITVSDKVSFSVELIKPQTK